MTYIYNKVLEKEKEDPSARILLDLKDVNFVDNIHERPIWSSSLSFELNRGELIAVYGPSGAGKSSLLDAILNIRPPQYTLGKIEKTSNFAYLTTKNFLFEPSTIQENIEQYYTIYNYKANKKDLYWYLQQVENLDLKAQVAQLSFGTKRRLSLYRTLYINADLYFLDEPTTGFDVSKIKQTNYFLSQMVRKEKKGVLVISHEPSTANIADKIVLVSKKPLVLEKKDVDFFIKVNNEGLKKFQKMCDYLGIQYEKVFQYSPVSIHIYRINEDNYQVIKKLVPDLRSDSFNKASKTPFSALVSFFLSALEATSEDAEYVEDLQNVIL